MLLIAYLQVLGTMIEFSKFEPTSTKNTNNKLMDYFINNSPIIGLFLFIIFFCLVISSLFKKDSNKKFKDYANIPLKEDEK